MNIAEKRKRAALAKWRSLTHELRQFPDAIAAAVWMCDASDVPIKDKAHNRRLRLLFRFLCRVLVQERLEPHFPAESFRREGVRVWWAYIAQVDSKIMCFRETFRKRICVILKEQVHISQHERNNLSEQELRDLSRKRAAVTMLSRSGYVALNNNGNVQLPDGRTTLPYTWEV